MFNPRRHETTVKNALQSTEPQYKAPLRRTLLSKLTKASLTMVMPVVLLTGLSACNSDDDNDTATTTNPDTSHYSKVTFNPAGSYLHGDFDESAAEITDFHPASQRAFIVNSQNKKIDVLDIQDIHNPVLEDSLDVSDIGGAVNSVAVHGDLVALAVQADVKTDNGYVVVYRRQYPRKNHQYRSGCITRYGHFYF